MKRILSLLWAIIIPSVIILAQTPQEIMLLKERLQSFAYATKVETDENNGCKVHLSSGDSLALQSGDAGIAPFASIDINESAVIAQPHKGKAIIISRTPKQREALMALYKATKGKLWERNEGWGKKKIPVDRWDGIDCDENGDVIHIKLSNNYLMGKLPDIFYAFPKLRKLFLSKNMLTGEVPRSLAWLPDDCEISIDKNNFTQTTLYVPRHRVPVVAQSIKCYPQKEQDSDFRLFIDCDTDLNPVNGHYADNECRLYHKASEGAGIDVYIVGEGFDKAEYAVGGTAEYWLERAADAIFDIKPFSQLKHLFNVYIIYSHSPVRGISMYEDKIDSRFGYWVKRPKETKNTFKKQEVFNTCKESAIKAGFEFKPEGTVYAIMIANCTRLGGVEYSLNVKENDEKRNIRVGINTTFTKWFNALVWHEFGGHAFGRLLDEYNKGGLTKVYKKPEIRNANADTESDPTKVKWAKFIADPRYAEEEIGVYQGARSYRNVYRPTKSSVMRTNRPDKRFNAPSRAEIYRRAMQLAFPGWEFDYETFVKFDLEDKYYPLEKE